MSNDLYVRRTVSRATIARLLREKGLMDNYLEAQQLRLRLRVGEYAYLKGERW